jgi:aminoglycoside phosphotransferase (APT) family kinase protein
MVDIQHRVARLPAGRGFGYGEDAADPHLRPTWQIVLDQHLDRSRSRMVAAGLVDPAIVDRVAARLNTYASALTGVRPVCFLDDTTTKNVLLHHGRLNGIVDVDSVCYGDPLRTVALTRMSLLASHGDTVYTDAWTAALEPSPEQLELLDVYTAMYGVDFLSELGQLFNRDNPLVGSPEHARRLIAIVDKLLED